MIDINLRHIKDFHHWTRNYDWGSGTPCDSGFFTSVVKIEDGSGYIGATRIGNCGLNDYLKIIKYDNNFNLKYNKIITGGEDPRTFVYKTKPYTLTWNVKSNGVVYKIIDLLEEKIINLDIENVKSPSPLQYLGKNWMPLVKDGDLYIVVTIDPQLTVLKCDIKTGKCLWVTPFDKVKNGLSISLNRGGTSLLFDEKLNLYFGLGHRTYNYLNHKPFLYTIDNDFKNVYIGKDLITGKQEVEDPASIFEYNEKYYSCINNLRGGIKQGEVGIYEIEFTQKSIRGHER